MAAPSVSTRPLSVPVVATMVATMVVAGTTGLRVTEMEAAATVEDMVSAR